MTTENKPVTIKDLQTFIEAVEFAADTENWVPSERQWGRIRSMIDNLVSDQGRPQLPDKDRLTPQQPAIYRDPNQPMVMSPSGMAAHVAVPRMPPQPVQLPPIFSAPGSQAPAKTPDIDTSGGEYKSGFA